VAERVYCDTSALAKWYILEASSEEVQAYLHENAPIAISSLTAVEMRSLLARRCREGAIDPRTESILFSTFLEEIQSGHLVRHFITENMWEGAVHLLGSLHHFPLKTLDALHIAAARETGTGILATADRVMADAARELEMEVVWFGR